MERDPFEKTEGEYLGKVSSLSWKLDPTEAGLNIFSVFQSKRNWKSTCVILMYFKYQSQILTSEQYPGTLLHK